MTDGRRDTILLGNKKNKAGRQESISPTLTGVSDLLAPLFLFLQGVDMKRFTETLIWDDPWYRKLPPSYKLFWKYLCDRCDNVGVWAKDMETACYFIGESLDEDKALQLFNEEKERVIILTINKWYIKEFVEFQFGNITPESNIGKSIIKLIDKYNETGIQHPLNGRSTAVRRPFDDRRTAYRYGKVKVRYGKVKYGELIKDIIKDLNIVLGTAYKPSTFKNKELISSRLEEGFTFDDFKTVHRKMLKAWGADSKMVKYLRPITLYGTKFEGYLNQKEVTTKLTETGIKAYLVGQEWLKKSRERDGEQTGQRKVHESSNGAL